MTTHTKIKQLLTLSTATQFTRPFICDGSQVLDYINSMELHMMMNPLLDDANVFRSILITWDDGTSQRFFTICNDKSKC